MAVRQRFNKAEREAFVVGTRVEWLNGSHWQPGTIVDNIKKDSIGVWRVGVTNHATTRTVLAGDYISARPGGVRLAPQSD